MTAQEIVTLLQKKDPAGMEALLRDYGPLMRYVMAPILPDPREQEECLHDVSLRVWENIRLFDPQKGNFKAWLTTLTRNAAINRARDGQKHRASALSEAMPSPHPGPEETALQKERQAELLRALSGLSARDRSLFYRKYWYLQSTDQIAAELRLSPRAVEGRLYRIRKRLRRELGGDDL